MQKQKLAHQLLLLATVYIILCLIPFFPPFSSFLKTVISTTDICPINLDHHIAKSIVILVSSFFILTKIDDHLFCFPHKHKHFSVQKSFC